jgi:hypothetical protein
MTIRITIKNDDDSREVVIDYVDPADPMAPVEPGSLVIGPQAQAEAFVHATQGLLIREVQP